MKKNIILLFLLTTATFAQMSSQIGWMSKFGLAGGANASWIFPNYDEINKQLPEFGINEKFSGGLLTWGGSGYVYLMIIDNLRIGGMGFGGSQSLNTNTPNYNREVIYKIGGGAFTVEYSLPFIKKIGVSVGGMIGGGSLSVELYQFNINGGIGWDDSWGIFNVRTGTKNFSRVMNCSYFTLTPTFNVDIPLTRFFAIRVGTGYQFTMNENWELANGQSLSGVPSSVNGDAFFIQTGIYLGFFAF